MSTPESGEEVYRYTVRFTGVTEYGPGLDALLSGAVPMPPQGARFDVGFAGECEGRLGGTLSGVDYLRVRPDGRIELDIRGEVSTPDGHTLAFRADGVGIAEPGSPLVQVRENVTFFSGAEPYAWVNRLQFWGKGAVDLAKGEVTITGYVA